MRSFTILTVVMGAFVIVGCSETPKATPIPVAQVPVDIMKTARDNLPNIPFEQALRRADGSFEIRGIDKHGKARDIDISSDGQVIAIE